MEQKLADHGVAKKLVPPDDVIARTARNKWESLLHDRVSEIVGEILIFEPQIDFPEVPAKPTSRRGRWLS